MFIGIVDVTIIRAEGMRQNEDEAADILRQAESIVARVAA